MVIHYGAQSITFSRRPIIMGALLSRWVNWLPPGKSVATLAVPSDANFTEPHHLFQSGDTDVQTLLGGGLMLWLAWAVSAALIAFGRYLLGDTYAYAQDVPACKRGNGRFSHLATAVDNRLDRHSGSTDWRFCRGTVP
jgi:hypothetical protein